MLCIAYLSSTSDGFAMDLTRKHCDDNRKSIDLRSDTVTRPTPAMRQAMFECEVGDDVFGDDPTMGALEKRAATLLGKESSLFFPSGTMANLAATMTWCTTRGSEILLGDSSHMFLYEQAGAAQLAGVATRVVNNKRDGTMNIDTLESSLRSDNIHFPVTELLCLENTHNYCGGRVLPDGYTEAVSWMAQKRGIPLHIDGARIWNAAAATKQPVSVLTKHADSITACFSKGLGAPVGSILAGSSKFIAKARRARKALGGGMRQVGVLAAAASVALDDFEAGVLDKTHAQAKILAKALYELPGFGIDLDAVETNIILVHIDDDFPASPAVLAEMMQEKGILVLAFGPKTLRVVTHRDISTEDLVYIIDAFREVSKGMWPRPNVTKNATPPSNALLGIFDVGTTDLPSWRNSSAGGSIKDSDGWTKTTTVFSGKDKTDLRAIPAYDLSSNPDKSEELREVPAGKVQVVVPSSISKGTHQEPPMWDSSKSTSPASAALDIPGPPMVGGNDAPNAPGNLRVIEIMNNQASVRDAWEQQALKENVDVKAYVEFDQLSESGSEVGGNDVLFTRGIAELEADEVDKEYYEEAVVHGMSVSNEGFCVFLRGAVCDRVVKVHVTPSDPMADGLDSEQVETPEAVTLLQLLQGIDVESHLNRDALTAKFEEAMSQDLSMTDGRMDNVTIGTAIAMGKPAFGGRSTAEETSESLPLVTALPKILGESTISKNSIISGAISSSGDASSIAAAVVAASNRTNLQLIKPQQLVLRRVMVTEVTAKPTKKFKARLCGCVRRQNPIQMDGAELSAFSSAEIGLRQPAVPTASILPTSLSQLQTQGGVVQRADRLFTSAQSMPIAPSIEGGTMGNGLLIMQGGPFPGPNGLASSVLSSETAKLVSSEKICARVDVQSAFEAVALALRHSAVIEVKSSLYQDQDISYTLDELREKFPRLLEADISLFDSSRPLSLDYDARNEVWLM